MVNIIYGVYQRRVCQLHYEHETYMLYNLCYLDIDVLLVLFDKHAKRFHR